MPFLSPNQQCHSSEGIQSTDPNQWPGLTLSLSITRLLIEGWFCRLVHRKEVNFVILLLQIGLVG